MGNMSYCRFENTSSDMEECVEALDEAGWDTEEMINQASSEHERDGIRKFIRLCHEVFESTKYFDDWDC